MLLAWPTSGASKQPIRLYNRNMMHFARTTYVNFTEQDAAEIAIAKRKGVDAGIKNNSKRDRKRQKTML